MSGNPGIYQDEAAVRLVGIGEEVDDAVYSLKGNRVIHGWDCIGVVAGYQIVNGLTVHMV